MWWGSSGGGETCGGGLHMLDLSEPSRPAFAGCFFDGKTGRRGTGYSHDAQCVIYDGPDEDYQGREICLGSNETALSISDVSDKDNPVSISMASYPAVAYAHQGWLTDDHRFFYMNDEGDEPQGLVEGTRTLIWDVEDLDEPILAAEYIATTPDTDHNLYIRGNLMYQSNYGAGLRILDITTPHRTSGDRLLRQLALRRCLVEQLPVLRERGGGNDQHRGRPLHRQEHGEAEPDSVARDERTRL